MSAPKTPASAWTGVVRAAALFSTAGSACLLGVLDLICEGAGSSGLTQLGSDSIPMAPLTGLMFVLFGVAVCLRIRLEPGPRQTRAGAALVAALSVVAAIRLVLGLNNIHLDAEHLGFAVTGSLDGVPLGHMSPVTAALFILAGAVYLLSLTRSATQIWPPILSLVVSFVLWESCFVFLLGYLLEAPLLYGEGLIPPALGTVLGLSALSIALMLLASRFGSSDRTRLENLILLYWLFLLLGTGFVAAGFLHYRTFQTNFLRETERRIAAMVEMKTEEISRWRNERVSDAAIYFDNPTFAGRVRQLLSAPGDPAARRDVIRWLSKAREHIEYDQVRLLDVRGEPVAGLPELLGPPSRVIREAAQAVGEARRARLQEFYRHDRDGRSYLAVVVPVTESTDGPAVGVVALRIDPAHRLYPMLRRWPIPGETNAVVLVRQEGSRAVALSPLPHTAADQPRWEATLDESSDILVRAVSGRLDLFEGMDAKGGAMLALARPVRDTPWLVVSMIDREEAYVPLRERLWMTVLFVFTVILGTAAGLSMIWRHQRARFFQDKLRAAELLRDSESRFRRVLEKISLIGVVLDERGSITLCNDHLLALTGWRKDEVVGRNWFEIFVPPEIRGRIQHGLFFPAIIDGTLPAHYENEIVTRAGERRLVSWSNTVLHDADGEISGVASLGLDITEQRRAEAARQRSEENVEALVNASIESTFMLNREGTVLVSNEVLPRRLKLKRSELVGRCIYDFLPPEIAASRRAQAERVYATGGPIRFTDCHAGRWVDHHLVPIRDESGQVSRIAVFADDITDRKEAVETLEAEQKRLKHLFQAVPVGIVTSVDRQIYEVNDTICAMLGYERAEIVGETVQRFYSSDEEFGRVDKVIAGELLVRGHATIETRLRRKDGAIIDVLMGGSVIVRDSARPFVIAAVLDITDRKEIERKLRKSESRLRQAQRIFGLGVWEWEIKSDRMEWSGEMFAIYGIARENFTGLAHDYVSFVHPEDRAIQRAIVDQAIARAADGGGMGPPALQYRIVRPDGSICWVEAEAEAVLDADGEPSAILGTLVDITARKTIEATLRDTNEQLRKAQQVARLGSYQLEIATGVWTSSRQLDEIFGIEGDYPHTVRGWLDLVAPDQRAEMTDYFTRHVLQERRRFEKEYRIRRHSDGQERWVSGVGELESDRQDRPVRMVGTILDVTEKKQLEAQFRQAQKMEVVGQLAGGVAHDFNNILTAMTLNLALLRSMPLPVETRLPVREIEEMTQRAARLTQQLLLFARRQAMQKTTLEINAALTSVLAMLRRLLGEHITLNLVSSSPSLWVDGDPGMLDQVVMNLCINARDAMPKGGILTLATETVTIDETAAAAFPEARAGEFVCLRISDTGVGMAPEVLQHVFEPFFTTKEVGKGTGLGLAAVHGIVHQHQGWVSVESAVGQGTTFRVFLPSHPKPESLGEAAPAEAPLPRGTETILLVEDEPVVRKISVIMLQKLGYKVLEAADAREAMRQWEATEGRIDLLFTDMVMPGGLSGLELVQRFRQENPRLKVILMSGYSAEIIKGDRLVTGGIVFLPKPFEVKALATTVRRCLDED